jgi:subtilisin family serine protease
VRPTRRGLARVAGVCAGAAFLAALAAFPPAIAAPRGSQVPRWNAAQIDLGPAQIAGHDGRGVIVAVLDTWVDAAHPDFGGRVLRGATCLNDAPCHPGGTTRHDGCEAHGTHVSGIIASASYGVAPLARILPVRVLHGRSEATCTASSVDVAHAVRWAAAHGARIINISLAPADRVPGQITVLAAAIDAVSRRGDLVIAAAGNQHGTAGGSFGPDAVVVAATGRNRRLAPYSERGAGVDFAAPGGSAVHGRCTVSSCVVSTWADNGYAALDGTSMAAAHVSGLAALLIAQDPARTRASVVDAMERTAHHLAGAGHGLIDAAAALAYGARTLSGAASGAAHHTSRGHSARSATRSPAVQAASVGQGSALAAASWVAGALIAAQVLTLARLTRRRSGRPGLMR